MIFPRCCSYAEVLDEPQHASYWHCVGSARHRVAVGLSDGHLIDEFDVDHHTAGFKRFFHRIAALEACHMLSATTRRA